MTPNPKPSPKPGPNPSPHPQLSSSTLTLTLTLTLTRRDCIALLVNPGNADVNARCPLQDTFPLLLAANFNHTECVQLLLDAKADATMRTQRSGLNALHYACSDAVVGYLRDAGASTVASVDEDGNRVDTGLLDSSARALREEEAAARGKSGMLQQQHADAPGSAGSASAASAAGAAIKSIAAARTPANRATAGGCTAEDLWPRASARRMITTRSTEAIDRGDTQAGSRGASDRDASRSALGSRPRNCTRMRGAGPVSGRKRWTEGGHASHTQTQYARMFEPAK